MARAAPNILFEKLTQYVANGKLNRKQSKKIRSVLLSLFEYFMLGELSTRTIDRLQDIRRGKTNLAEEFKILSLYNEMDFSEIYSSFQVTESDIHNMKKYYSMYYYKFPSKDFEKVKCLTPYLFQGTAIRRSIRIYDAALEVLNSIPNLRFKVLELKPGEVSILLGGTGKRTKYYLEEAAIQIKNMKLNPPSAGHIFGDLYKCLRFSSRTSKKSFFLINKHWKVHPYFVDFEGASTAEFSETHKTHIIFTDYKPNWQEAVLNELEAHLL
jgi:hypothetical protein